MKVLIINTRFFLSAGPEKYMFGIINILQKHGHKVIPFSIKNSKNQETPYSKYFAEPVGGEDKVYYEEYDRKNPKVLYQMVERQFYSLHVKKRLKKLIRDTKPDIAYILHHYNKLSPSIIDACKESGLPVVMRLSDFGLVCASGPLMRNGSPCEDCIEKSLFCAVRHKCVKKSYISSAIKASAMKFHRIIKVYDKVDYVISPSTFTISRFEKVFKNKIVHIPTFIDHKEKYNPKLGDYAIFVGRVEAEKGLLWAIKSFEKAKGRLKVVGASHSGHDQVLKDYIKEHKMKNIEFTGAKFGEDLAKLYRGSRFMVLPVVWYENMPNVALESMSFSRPIITSDIGSMKEIVMEGYNGLLVKPNDIDGLREKINLLFKNGKLCKKLGKNAFNESINKYSPKKHYAKLIKVFEKAIEENKKK